MKKKIFRSFATLLGLTCTAKLFSVLCRIILARTLSSEGYGLYMLVLPTLGFCLTLALMGIRSAVFRLSSDPHYQPKRVLKKALSLSLVISLTIAFLLALPRLSSPICSSDSLKQPVHFMRLPSLFRWQVRTTHCAAIIWVRKRSFRPASPRSSKK